MFPWFLKNKYQKSIEYLSSVVPKGIFNPTSSIALANYFFPCTLWTWWYIVDKADTGKHCCLPGAPLVVKWLKHLKKRTSFNKYGLQGRVQNVKMRQVHSFVYPFWKPRSRCDVHYNIMNRHNNGKMFAFLRIK